MIGQLGTALITGASRGIGVHLVRALAARGMTVVLAARSAGELGAVAGEINAQGGRAIAVPTDLRSPVEIERLAAAAAHVGPVDLLVNNAGIDNVIRFEHEDPAAIAEITFVNLTAPMILTRLVLPQMLRQQRGHIVSIASLAAKVPFPLDVTYAAAKAGLAHFTACLRAEHRGSGVSASVILAGQFRGTGMVERALAEAGVSQPGAVRTSDPADAARAVVRAIERDIPELAVPAPAIMFARHPRLGEAFLTRTHVREMLADLADAHAPQAAQEAHAARAARAAHAVLADGSIRQ